MGEIIVFIILVAIAVWLILRMQRTAASGRETARNTEEERVPCPFCAEKILPAAKVCPFCRSGLPGK